MNIKENSLKEQALATRLFKYENSFYKLNTASELKSKALYSPIIKDLSLTGMFYTNSLQSDDLITSTVNLAKKDFSQFVVSSNTLNIDESYVNYKEFTNYLTSGNQTVLGKFNSYQAPQSYINTLNMYRADYDDFGAQTDSTSTEDLPLNLSSLSTTTSVSTDTSGTNQPTLRLSNPLVLRSTSKNSIVTYNALQKVFRSRFDEGRSLTSLAYFSDLAAKQPFMSSGRVPYESLLGKNRESFFSTTFYNANISKLINFTTNPLNTYFFEFPFLSSQNSDVSRHL